MDKKGKISRKSNRAQITIFVILAIAIIASIIIAFYPQIKKIIVPPAPGEMIPRDCVRNAVLSAINTTMLHGGKVKPSLYFMYNNYSIQYICYTNDWYKTCVMQVPFLKESIEAEVNAAIQQKVQDCFGEMETSLKSRGYELQESGTRKASINIIPEKINFSIDLRLTLNRGEEATSFDSNSFKFDFSSKSYDLLMVAASIQNYEARYGDSAPEMYMNYYPNIKVEKKKQDDGTKVYILTERNTGEILQFATRSLAWPPGWALPSTFAQQ